VENEADSIRALERGIARTTVLAILQLGEMIEQYPDDYPFPSFLMLGFHDEQPIHVVAALDFRLEELHIITVYHPDLRWFESDWRTRRTS